MIIIPHLAAINLQLTGVRYIVALIPGISHIFPDIEIVKVITVVSCGQNSIARVSRNHAGFPDLYIVYISISPVKVINRS